MARKSCTGFDFTSVCFGVQVAVVEDGVSLGAAQRQLSCTQLQRNSQLYLM